MPQPPPAEAVIALDSGGRYVDANEAALALLGVSLAELRSSAPDRFSIRPTTEPEQAALRDQWQRRGAHQPLVGTAGMRRADGSTIRVGYEIEASDAGFLARLWPVEGAPEAPASVYTVGDVLREWRAAERELAELTPGTPEWTRASSEFELLRGRYQEFFKASERPRRDG
jgi:PAS domain-containing protein